MNLSSELKQDLIVFDKDPGEYMLYDCSAALSIVIAGTITFSSITMAPNPTTLPGDFSVR